MNANTVGHYASSLKLPSQSTLSSGIQGDPEVAPRARVAPRPSAITENYLPDEDYVAAKAQVQQKRFDAPLPLSKLPRPEAADSTVMQVWEGRVLEVDHDKHAMQVLLNPKMGQVPSHTGEVELEWVSEQDMDLVRPGAIFYLTLSKRIKRSGIENAQELRFRRLPSWTKQQIAKIERDANTLLSKMKVRPTPE